MTIEAAISFMVMHIHGSVTVIPHGAWTCKIPMIGDYCFLVDAEKDGLMYGIEGDYKDITLDEAKEIIEKYNRIVNFK